MRPSALSCSATPTWPGLMTRAGWMVVLAALASLGLALLAGFAGVLTQVPMPLIAVRVWGGVALLLGIYLGVPSRRRWAAGLHPGGMAACHVWRVLPGAAFLWLSGTGVLPARFGVPAGIGETIVGLTALPAGYWLGTTTPRRRRGLAAWHVLGLAELLQVMGSGIALHLAGDRLIDSMSRFPMFLLPLFAVPVTLAMHVLATFALLSRPTERRG